MKASGVTQKLERVRVRVEYIEHSSHNEKVNAIYLILTTLYHLLGLM